MTCIFFNSDCNNHANKFVVGDFTFYFSYNTLVAYNDGSVTYRTVKDEDIDKKITNTTSKHLSFWFGQGKNMYRKLTYKEFNFEFYFKKINNI